MKKYSFTKMSGAGNDFVIIDKAENSELNPDSEFVQALCHRRNGIGADGVIVIDDKPGYDFVMEYYNADGSTGTLCGNGARCSIMFAEKSLRLKDKKALFLSGGIEYSGEVINDEIVKFNLNQPKELKPGFEIKTGCLLIKSSFVDTGSPHAVIRIEDIFNSEGNPEFPESDIDKLPVFELGKELRYCSTFAPKGSNINFISIKDGKVYIRTYERGVEDETLACGTGSVASAIISFLNYGVEPPVTLVTRSGKELLVDFSAEGNVIQNVSLTGPAIVTFKGDFFY